MKDLLENVPSREYFTCNGKKYFILRRESNMVEVQDSTGRKWAWHDKVMVSK